MFMMFNRIVVILFLILISVRSMAQNNEPQKISSQVLQQIASEVKQMIPAYKASLEKQALNKDQIAFSIDTFYIEQVLQKRINLDYTTAGMNTAILDMVASYDKLLNKYYNKLLNLLQAQDKSVLITAQKAWLQFRDSESKLMRTLSKDVYSGGGTIQSNIVNGAYADLVVNRCIELFNYYDTLEKSN